MTAGELQVLDDFAALPADVRAPLEQAGRCDFQAGLAWLLNLVDTVDFGAAEPRLYVWRERGRPRALLPLLAEQGARGCTLSSLGNYYTTRWAPLVADEGEAGTAALQALLEAIFKREAPVASLRCNALEAGSRIESALHAALRAAGCAVFPFHGFANWVLPVRTGWPDYLAARDGRLRTTLSRMGRRFAARGGRIELIDGSGEAELAPAIAAYEHVYAASWKQPEPHPRFMPGLIRAAAAGGQLRMALARLDGQAVAAQVWLLSGTIDGAGGRAEICKLAHDEAHKDLSPGTLLTAALMQQAFERDGVHTVDYLSGDDAYKRLWMSEQRERRGVIAYPMNTAAGLAGAARELTRTAAGRAWRRLRRGTAAGAALDGTRSSVPAIAAGGRARELP